MLPVSCTKWHTVPMQQLHLCWKTVAGNEEAAAGGQPARRLENTARRLSCSSVRTRSGLLDRLHRAQSRFVPDSASLTFRGSHWACAFACRQFRKA